MGVFEQEGGVSTTNFLNLRQEKKKPRLFPNKTIRLFSLPLYYTARGGSGASHPLYYTVPEDNPELPVHCIIQCQRRIRSFPSTVLYSARGGSGASRIQCQRRIRSFPSTYYTVPEEDPELPVHCIIQCQRRIRSFPSTVLYSARGGSGASRPVYYTVPEEDPELPVHCIIQCQRRIRSFPIHCIIQCQRRIRSFPIHCILQCQRRIRSFPSIVLYSARGGSGASRPQRRALFHLSSADLAPHPPL